MPGAMTRREAVAVSASVPVMSMSSPAFADYDPLADLRAAYAAWQEADDHLAEVNLAADADEPPTEWFQVSWPTEEMIADGKQPQFWVLTRERLDRYNEVTPSWMKSPNRKAYVADLEARLTAYEAAVQAVKDRHGQPEAERRLSEAISALTNKLALALQISPEEAIDDLILALAAPRVYGRG